MKRLLVLLLVVLSSTTACRRSERVVASRPLPVGVVLPLTGDGAGYGTSIKRGIELAREQTPFNSIALHYEDSIGDAQKSITALRKLIDADRVPLVIGPFSSSEAFAMLPVANRAGVVVVSVGASAPGLSQPNDTFFRIVASDVFDGDVLARFAQNELKAKTAALLYNNSEYGVGVRAAFERRFTAGGGRILTADGYSPTDSDVRTLLSKIKAASPDILLLIGYKEMGNIVKQAKEQRVGIPILSTGLFEDPDVLHAAGDSANGVWYSFTSFDPQSRDQSVTEFVKRYRARYGADPDILSALGYDAMRLVVTVTENGTVRDPKAVMTKLYSVKNFPAASGDMTFDRNGDVSKPFGIKHIVSGKPEWYRAKL